MNDGKTREILSSQRGTDGFLSLHRVTLVVVQGGAEGTEFEIENERVTLGRGIDADLRFEDDTLSQIHMALEVAADLVRVRDLDSTNGVHVNGAEVKLADLKHGDRIEAGGYTFLILIDEREPQTRTIRYFEE